ncbi:MAG: aminotransferase class V-fold PLP-dependent enzyme [Candidatus Micrarchaeota archaeon]|nr:aminotransferase class V-fold PLP-dependent enzyme [Candidatus Micrarchaeota archaeon]
MGILLSPGPVHVPQDVMLAQVQEMITHRSGAFKALYTDLCTRSAKYLNAEEAYVITGSGTLGIEAAILNCCLPEEKMLVLSNGNFGDLLATTAEVYTKVDKKSIPAGKGWDLHKAKEHIDHSDAKVFGMVYNETGYGVRNHAKEIYQYAKKKGMYTIMDSVSGWPSLPMDMKEFGVDFFVTGVQKAIGAPPGAAVIGLSKEAIARFEGREKIPSHYCNLNRHRKTYKEKGQTPNTPAITVFWAIQRCYDHMDKNGGIPAWVEKHRVISEYVRGRITEMGLELIPEKGFESWSLTAFKHGKAADVKKLLADKYGISIVGCKGDFKDNGLRIAHMGLFDKKNLEIALDILEEVIEQV